MNDLRLNSIRDLIQQDVVGRGLAADPKTNLINAFPGDFGTACHSIASASNMSVAIVTGFFIPTGLPPAGETDGPLGAIFLARALSPLGIRVALVSDHFCRAALDAGLRECGLDGKVNVITLPPLEENWADFLDAFFSPVHRPTHLIALERVGPSHTAASISSQAGGNQFLHEFHQHVPAAHHGRCHTMRGIDVSKHMGPAHLLFEAAPRFGVATIGIGDGGNEIGMGKLSWDVIRRNIPGGAKVACRSATDHLIVAGISNWGAYGLGAGVWALAAKQPPPGLFDAERERELLAIMVAKGPLVDGVTGKQCALVDGLPFEHYAEVLRRLYDHFV